MVLRPHILQWSGEGPKEGQGRRDEGCWWLKMLENRNSEIGIGRINGLVVREGILDSAMLGVCQNNLFFFSSSGSNERVDTLFQKFFYQKRVLCSKVMQ